MSERPSAAAVGWTAFAGTTMFVLGTWWLIAGLVGIFDSGELFVATERWIFRLDAKTWGWIHIVEGIVVLAAGIGIFKGAGWARMVGVILSVITGLSAFAWLPWYPIWALVLIAVSLVVICVLTVHGHEFQEG
jgi:hypothetical protein